MLEPSRLDPTSLSESFTWTKSDLFFGLLQALCLLCVVCQVFIDSSVDNLNCVALVALSSSLVFQYLWRSGAPRGYPISSLAVLGLCVTTQYAALVAQTLGWTSFIQLLRWPVVTFGVLAAVQVLAVGTHWVHRHMALTKSISQFIATKVLTPMGALSVPPIGTIWLMALLGAISTATAGGIATGDVGGKAFQALAFMTYMPFLIPIYHRRYGQAYCDIKKQAPLLLAYVALLVLIAMVRNSRQLMAIGPVQAGLIFLIYSFQDSTPITRRTIARLIALTVATSVATVLFSQLAIAMVINRDKIEILKPLELIEETLRTLTDRPRLEQYQKDALDAAKLKRYDETYLASPVISRFSETKFHDNNIFVATTTTEAERQQIWDLTGDMLLATLPQPALDALDIKIQKNDLRFTFGDFNRYLTEGQDGTLGGYATGSIWGHVIALFGLGWAPLVVALILLPSYVVLDGFSRPGSGFGIAPMVMGSTWIIFIYGLGGESLVFHIGFYARDLPQRLVLYCAVYAGIHHGWLLLKGRALA